MNKSKAQSPKSKVQSPKSKVQSPKSKVHVSDGPRSKIGVPSGPPKSPERLQKILANAGIASRRAGEEMIAAGRVRVNGTVGNQMGGRGDPATDHIEVDGKPLH